MHTKKVLSAGKDLKEAKKVLVMVHGRGGNAAEILSLASHLEVNDFALLAPEATNNTWYPYSFLAPVQENEPWLSSALELLESLVSDINKQGIKSKNIYFLGFSQGACLTLEFVARNAKKFGGVVAFTGGLVGDVIRPENYSGDFDKATIFIGTGHPDPHVPVERVHQTTKILTEMNAVVIQKVYENKPHNISKDEIEQANHLFFS